MPKRETPKSKKRIPIANGGKVWIRKVTKMRVRNIEIARCVDFRRIIRPI